MYIQQLKNIMLEKNLSRSNIARLAQVSGAAVSKWFSHTTERDWINVETGTVIRLAQGPKISPDQLLKPTPRLGRWQTQLLWDHLYPTMEAFAKALLARQLPAVARLTQVLGLRNAARLVGKWAIRKFPDYKRYIKPARRKELELLWPLYQ